MKSVQIEHVFFMPNEKKVTFLFKSGIIFNQKSYCGRREM